MTEYCIHNVYPIRTDLKSTNYLLHVNHSYKWIEKKNNYAISLGYYNSSSTFAFPWKIFLLRSADFNDFPNDFLTVIKSWYIASEKVTIREKLFFVFRIVTSDLKHASINK